MNRPRACAAVLKDDKILMVCHQTPSRTYWTFPGGGVNEGEPFDQAAVREVKEETGLDVKVIETLSLQANPAFRFVVDVEGERQAAFTECALPTLEWEVEEIKEGGLNTYTHQLPGRRKGARISLKNGIGKSTLLNWYLEAIDKAVTRKPLTITLLNSLREPVMVWDIQEFYPVKWSGPQLKSDDNTIAIQTLELVCGDISVSLEAG